MHEPLQEPVYQLKTRRKARKIIRKAAGVMGCLVAFVTTYALILPAITMEKTTFCGVDEHTHHAGCYQQQIESRNLICGNHVHDSTCYAVPELEPVIHSHQDSCVVNVMGDLICELPESEEHTHSDTCYHWDQTYACGMEEGQPETVDPVLTCGEEVTGHVHEEDCFQTQLVDAEPICGQIHEHTYLCYQKLCSLTEHTHSLQCYSDPDADVESQQVWEATMQNVELTGDGYLDVIAVAESQLGYAESTRNYWVGEDNSLYGYTRYGDWYGVPYGDWCAMYASFCLRYAGLDAIPVHSAVEPWIEELTAADLYRSAAEAQPKPGCLVFFDWNANASPDHVGIVVEVTEAGEHQGAELKTIEGNCGDTVQYVNYALNDPEILGYGFLVEEDARMPEQQEISAENRDPLLEILTCGTPAHTHDGSCGGTADKNLCQKQEHIHMITCADASSPVGYAKYAAMTRTRFAIRTSEEISYHENVAPLLGSIVIVDANQNTIYNSNNPDAGSNEITLGDIYMVELTFNESSTNQFDTGKLYYEIPSYLRSDKVSNGVIKDELESIVAYYTINDNQLIVTPVGATNFFEVHNDASFKIQFNAEAVFDSDTDDLIIDFNGNYQVVVNTKENGTINAQKELVEYDPLTRIITYKCMTKAHGGTVRIREISDYWWASGVDAGDVTVSRDTLTMTDADGNDISSQWNIVINDRSDIWMAPWNPVYLDHGEFITLTYQVQLSEDLTENFNFENTYYNYGSFGDTPLEDTSVVRTPIAFTNIEKNGVYVTEEVNGVSLDALEWTVEIANQNLEVITIKDQLSERQTFCRHESIFVKALKADGTKDYIEIPWEQVDCNEGNTQFTLTLPEGYLEYELIYRSHYELDGNNSNLQIFENTVTTNIYIGDAPTVGTGSVGVLGVLPRIDKQIPDSDEDWVTFSIDCFMPAGLYDRTSVHLYDTLASWGATDGFIGHYPDNLTVTVTPAVGEAYQLVPYGGQASAENTYLMDYDGQSFTMFFNTSQPQSTTSVWKCNVDSWLNVSYRVSLDSPMLDAWGGTPTEETLRQFLQRTGQGVDNNAQLNYSPNDYISDSVRYTLPEEEKPPLNKTGKPVTGEDGVFEYSVWFNAGKDENGIFSKITEYGYQTNDVADLKLTDVFDSRMEYVDGSLQVSLWGYWNHEDLVLRYVPEDGSTPAFETLEGGKTKMIVPASKLIGQEGSDWLTGRPLSYALKNLPEGYQYEFTYKLQVKEEVKKTTTEGILLLDNTAQIDWQTSTGPQSVGPAHCEVSYDTGILDKTMQRPSEDGNLVNFSILVNHNGLDLAPNSDTYILTDKMTPNLMLIYKSLKIEILDHNGNVVGQRTPEQCKFAYNPDENKMTFSLPDSAIIRLKYDCRVNGTGGNTVDVGNTVQLEGYSAIQDIVNTEFLIREHSGSADASSKSFILQKQDGYSFKPIPGVSFELYGDTERTGSHTIYVGNKKLYYYKTFTTDANGMVEIADSQLAAEHLYALVETTSPEGYLPQKEPYLFYMERPPLGGSADIDSIAEGALVVIKNYPFTYVLPQTGGTGPPLYTAVGGLLMLAALLLLYNQKKRRKEDFESS